MNVNGYEIKPGAYLQRAYLKGANLKGTNLEGANLEGANGVITNHSSFVISNSKKVGYYELVDGVRMESAVKPNPVVRFMTKWLLGWKWKDS